MAVGQGHGSGEARAPVHHLVSDEVANTYNSKNEEPDCLNQFPPISS
jgi:hypothetical protein